MKFLNRIKDPNELLFCADKERGVCYIDLSYGGKVSWIVTYNKAAFRDFTLMEILTNLRPRIINEDNKEYIRGLIQSLI